MMATLETIITHTTLNLDTNNPAIDNASSKIVLVGWSTWTFEAVAPRRKNEDPQGSCDES